MSSVTSTPLGLDPKDLGEFWRVLWAARRVHRRLRTASNPNLAEHVAAVSYASARGWSWGGPLMTALMLTYHDDSAGARKILEGLVVPHEIEGIVFFLAGVNFHTERQYDLAMEAYRKALQAPSCGNVGAIRNNIGLLYAKRKKYTQAIKEYEMALRSPGFDCKADTWRNIGKAYADKKDFSRAAHACLQALSDKDYESRGLAWNTLGVAYLGRGKFTEAVEAFHHALNTEGYESPGIAWYNIGATYDEQGDFNQAIFAYEKALKLPPDDSQHETKLSLANAYRARGDYKKAEDLVKSVLVEEDREGQHTRARHILTLLSDNQRSLATTPGEEALAMPSPSGVNQGPEGRMKDLLLAKVNHYETYLRRRSLAPLPDDFTVLRGWSSSVTLLEGGEERQWRGGGYLLGWRGHGIALDPGFDFIDNFHDAGFHASSIQTVVVSHNHPDHNHDLGSLDDLCYELFRRDRKMKPVQFVMDEDTAQRFPDSSPRHRRSPVKLTQSDFEGGRWLDGAARKAPFTLRHFPVNHGKDVRHAVGLRFHLHPGDKKQKDFVVGYTGDTKYSKKLAKHLRGVDLLIAHVSQPDPQEFNKPKHFKKYHLGYNGVINLVREVKPRLTLVGEFWAGLADLRLELIAGIRLRSGEQAVLPACLGLRLRLPDLTVRCTRCQKQAPAEKIKVAPPIREFGEIGYLCPGCIL